MFGGKNVDLVEFTWVQLAGGDDDDSTLPAPRVQNNLALRLRFTSQCQFTPTTP